MAPIVLTTVGSTGDINPIIAVGLRLKSRVHQVIFGVEDSFRLDLIAPGYLYFNLAKSLRGLTMSLYLREAGPVEAPCIVFLHGLWLSSAMWQPQIEHLSQNFHCLAPDLPEHGKSSGIGLLTLDNTSLIIAKLIRQRAANGRAHVVGLSLGGSVALGLLRDVPEVIDHMMISGSAAGFNPLVGVLSQLGKPLLRVLKPAPLLSFGLRHSKIAQPYLNSLLEDVSHLEPMAILHLANSLVKLKVPQGIGLQVQILVTFGQKEVYLTMADRAARQLGQTLPAQVVMVRGVGHLWNLQAPNIFSETLQAWITGQPLPKELVGY